MPVSYACDNCGHAGALGPGWYVVQVIGYRYNTEGERAALDSPAAEFYLHSDDCYAAWETRLQTQAPA